MGIYGRKVNSINESEIPENFNMEEYIQECIFIEFSQLPDEKLKQFLVSEDCKVLKEAGIIGKNTMVRLSKADDLTRRIKVSALQLAKDSGDSMWKLWDNYTSKATEIEKKILQKYNFTANKIGRISQKDYLKTHKIGQSFIRA